MATEKLTFEMNAVGNAVPEMKKVQAQLGSLDKTMMKSTANMNRHVRGMQGVGKANKNMTRSLGMASLQFQDMAVQASMGTDALRIMTMQGPQLASIFGPKGMILGALIAVGGAIAMMGDKTTKLSFDFKRFGADMKTAFQPLIDFVRPAVDLVVKGFDLLKRGAMAAINGIVNGINMFAVFISNVPAIVQEAFSRSTARIDLFGVQFSLLINDLAFRWTTFTSSLTEGFAETIDDLAGMMNELMGTDFATNNLDAAMNKTADRMDMLNDQMEKLMKREDELRAQLDKPFESYQNLQDELNNLITIDVFSYFKRIKQAGEETGAAVTTVADMIGDKFGDAFMSMVDGTKKAKDAFRTMAADIIKELYRVFVVKQITGFITNAITSAFPSFGGTPMKAIGGPVQRGNPYVVGERGPELFVPSRTGSIVPNDKMNGGGQVVVNQTINVSTGVQQTVRTEIRSLMPQIAESAKAAVADAKRRGGSYGRAFA
jgi:phage-related minor tail protein